MGFLRYDSDFMVMLGRIADYVILNVLCVIFSIPLFTVGAAVTAKYYVAMKLARKEEPNVFKAFINSFRDNFKQATLLWLLSVFLSAFLAMDWFLLKKTGMTNAVSFFQIALFVVTVLVVMSVFCVFPILARYHVTIRGAVRNAVLFSLLHLPKMILVIFLEVIPYYIGFHYMNWFIGIWLFCTTLSLYYAAGMYARAFLKVEHEKEKTGEEIQEKAGTD